jgi:hypothetical protein
MAPSIELWDLRFALLCRWGVLCTPTYSIFEGDILNDTVNESIRRDWQDCDDSILVEILFQRDVLHKHGRFGVSVVVKIETRYFKRNRQMKQVEKSGCLFTRLAKQQFASAWQTTFSIMIGRLVSISPAKQHHLTEWK